MIKIANSWDETFVDQYIALKDITSQGFYESRLEVLSILSDTLSDDDMWQDMFESELSNMISNLGWLKREPTQDFSKEIDGLSIIDINTLKFGEFIDLEYYFNENYINNLPTICAILYRKTKVDEWSNIIYEPYNYDITKRSKLFYELPITKVYGVIKYYLDFKKNITSQYDYIFEPIFDEEDIEGDNEYDEEDIEQEKAEELNKKWGWERVLYNLANEDITKYDSILEMPVIFIFNQLSFIKDIQKN